MKRLTNVLQAFKRLMADEYTLEEQYTAIDDIDADTVLESLLKLRDLEEQIYPTTLEKLVSVTVEMANKTEGKQADHIHILSDKESYKWEEILKLEEQIHMPLDVFVKLAVHDEDYLFTIKNDKVEAVLVDGHECYGFYGYIEGTWIIYEFSEYGKSWFMTYEEAEKKLEETTNENA